jgi:glutathione synthase/RimK-type ligase-like ATP-grasp enzyme
MAEIAIVYDRSETDEMGIKSTAEEKGIDLSYIPFHKISFGLSNNGFTYESLGHNYNASLKKSKIILNRTQSKSRRILASAIFENMGKKVINPQSVEIICQSKIRTLLTLSKYGINFPKTVYIPCNVHESKPSGGFLDYSKIVTSLLMKQFSDGKIVLKPDAGTHGRGIKLTKNMNELNEILLGTSPSIINPSGIVAQEFIPKWFYDLRIVVEKKKNKRSYCHPTAMARGGFKDFRTNTYLGNMVFRVNLPNKVRKEAERCGEAIAEKAEVWVLALDAMPYIEETEIFNENGLITSFDKLETVFNKVQKIKKDPLKKRNFSIYTKNIENAYAEYMSKEPYLNIQKVIQDTLESKKESVLFHEGNACPEFWEQTRIVGGINIADSLLNCAISFLDN